jgi:hypothetical protein
MSEFEWKALASEPLCVAEFEVGGGLVALGKSPWRSRRGGHITGGTFKGARLSGEILPGGGNWSEGGEIEGGVAVGTFDARTIWRTHDGAMIWVTYTGRSAIPPDVAKEFADPAAPEVDPSRYYIRIAPVFETSDPRYGWLNGVLAVGCGQRIPGGIRHWMFAIS